MVEDCTELWLIQEQPYLTNGRGLQLYLTTVGKKKDIKWNLKHTYFNVERENTFSYKKVNIL